MSVSDLNRQSIQAHVGFSASIDESDYSVVNFDQQVTTRARIAVDMDPNERDRLAALEAKVADLQKLKATIQNSGIKRDDCTARGWFTTTRTARSSMRVARLLVNRFMSFI